MLEAWLWAGRILVLGALLAYLWSVARRLAGGTASNLRPRSDEGPDALGAYLELVQDNAVDGVSRRGAGRVAVRGRVAVGEELTLGRQEENGLVLGDRFASGRHARVYRRGEGYWVEDLGSRNGTLLNGHRVGGPQALEAGDRITVGSCTFRFMR